MSHLFDLSISLSLVWAEMSIKESLGKVDTETEKNSDFREKDKTFFNWQIEYLVTHELCILDF